MFSESADSVYAICKVCNVKIRKRPHNAGNMLRHIRLKHPESYISPTEHPESYIAPPSDVKAVEENKITAMPEELQILAKMLGKDSGSPPEGESECDGGNMETDISSNKADSRLELNSAVPCLDKVNTKVMCKLTAMPEELQILGNMLGKDCGSPPRIGFGVRAELWRQIFQE